MASAVGVIGALQNFVCWLQGVYFFSGKGKSELGAPFWDVIVLTTADEEQKTVFEEQVRQKLERKELPLGVPIHVIADPPGPKLGISDGFLLQLMKSLN